MHNFFSYDSKLTQVLSFVADLLLTNLLFIVCSVPIVTIGAAQAGLYTAMRRLEDPLDGRSCIKAFFEGFKSGFLRISIVHVIFLVLEAVTVYTLMIALDWENTGLMVHWAVPLVVLIIVMLIHALTTPFHSRFVCKPLDLVRNSLLLLITHPLRSILLAALNWAPLLLFYLKTDLFLNLGALFFTVYYSIAYLFGVILLKKPFKLLIEDMEAEAADEVK